MSFLDTSSEPLYIKRKKGIEFLFIVAVLILAIVILTPRHWEPSQENWHKWAAARILRETGEFPHLAMGPLYVVYLQLFSWMKYPFSATLEYLITHLFNYAAIYVLLQHFIRRRYAVLLTVAWIPHLATVEPGGAIFGISFVCLYLMPGKSAWRNQGYLPPALIAAALSHTIYFAFLLGHIVGTFWETKNWPAFPFKNVSQTLPKDLAAGTMKIMLLSLLLAVMIVPFSGPDQNHILMDPTYAPIPLDSPFKSLFFTIGTERYVRRTFPENEWVYRDWYLSTPQAYGGATTVTQAILRKPETVFRNLVTNLSTGAQVPSFLFSGAFLGLISLLFLPFSIFGLMGWGKKAKEEKNYSQLWSIIIGTSAAVLIFALTQFNSARYVAILMPVGLLLLLHAAGGFSLAARYWIKKIGPSTEEQQAGNWPGAESAEKVNVVILGLGLLFLLLGLIINEQVIHKIVLPNQELPSFIARQIRFAAILFLAVGASLSLFNKKIHFYLQRIKKLVRAHPERISLWLQKVELKGAACLVIVSAILLLSTIHYPLGNQAQLQSVIAGDNFLAGQEPVSLADSYFQLQPYLNANTTVLTREYTWVMAFTNVKWENIYQIFSLPPFNGSREEIEEKLKNLDVIMVSYKLESNHPLIATQTYPRYVFHIKPFVEKARGEGWTEEKVAGYGTVYRKDN